MQQMEMPDEIYAHTDGSWFIPTTPMATIAHKYHHNRIVESLKRERDELQAKLDKAKDGLLHYANAENMSEVLDDFGRRARTILEEIE